MVSQRPGLRRALVDCPYGLGFDTDTRLAFEQYRELRALGLRFAGRYLGDLTSEEVDDANGADLGIIPIQHAHVAGWQVGEGAHTGAADGRAAVADANHAALPPMPLWCDLEEVHPSTTIEQVHQYAAEWCAQVKASGFEGRVYWGAGMPGDPHDVYMLQFDGYWKSFSNVAAPWRRGWQMVQLYCYPRGECLVRDVFPLASSLVANVAIDLDAACADYLGGRPRMVVAA